MPFLFRGLKTSDAYYPNWADLRERTLLAWMVLLAFCGPAFFVPWVLLRSVMEPRPAYWCSGAIAVVLVAWARVHQTRWPCPRCGRAFYATWYMYNPFINGCLHCGLPEYAPHGDF